MSKSLSEALEIVAERLSSGAPYQWGHMGQCNCGHVAQVLTNKTAREIHQSASTTRSTRARVSARSTVSTRIVMARSCLLWVRIASRRRSV
jgi:hypothetical protein